MLVTASTGIMEGSAALRTLGPMFFSYSCIYQLFISDKSSHKGPKPIALDLRHVAPSIRWVSIWGASRKVLLHQAWPSSQHQANCKETATLQLHEASHPWIKKEFGLGNGLGKAKT